MKELRYLLGKKQADDSIIFVKSAPGEQIELAFKCYDAFDYRSISFLKKTREVFKKLDEFDLYKFNMEVINMEPQREQARALKEAEELRKHIEKETAEDNIDVTEIEEAEKINEDTPEANEDTKEIVEDTPADTDTKEVIEEANADKTEVTENEADEGNKEAIAENENTNEVEESPSEAVEKNTDEKTNVESTNEPVKEHEEEPETGEEKKEETELTDGEETNS